MSPAALFVVGVLVTLTVGAAIALLIYAAILDGRHARAQKAAEHERALPLAAANLHRQRPTSQTVAPIRSRGSRGES